MTTNLIDGAEPLRLRITARAFLDHDSDLLLDQLRAVDNLPLVAGPLARLDDAIVNRVAVAIREILDIA